MQATAGAAAATAAEQDVDKLAARFGTSLAVGGNLKLLLIKNTHS